MLPAATSKAREKPEARPRPCRPHHVLVGTLIRRP
jgi:hypothetical protein